MMKSFHYILFLSVLLLASTTVSVADAQTPTVPDAPINAILTPHSTDSILSWSAPLNDGGSPITTYRVEFNDGSGWVGYAGGFLTPTSRTLSSLGNDLTFSYRVSAVNTIGTGAPTSFVLLTVPDAPVVLQAVIGDQQVELAWDEPFNGGAPIERYIIEYGTNGIDWFVLEIFSPETIGVVVDLDNGISYQFRISAVNAVGTGVPSAIISATPLTIPDEPRNLTATSGVASATLFWDEPFSNGGSPVTSYLAEWSLDSFANILGSLVIDPTAIQSDVSGLTPNTEHNFRISAINVVGISPPSNIFTVIPDDIPPTTLSLIKHSVDGIGTFEIQNTNSTGTQSHFVQTFHFNVPPLTTNIVPGTLQSLVEVVPPGWVQTGKYCSINGVDVTGNATSFTPAAGDDVICTFTNTKNVASLTIQKTSIGGTGTFEIQNTNSTGTQSHFLFTTFGFNGGSNSQNTLNITPGELQSLTEIVPPGWVLTGQYCNINGVPIPGNATSFTPSLGDDIACKFTNDIAKADIFVEKLVDATNLLEGDVVRYTINAFNVGPQDTTGVIIEDILPTGVTHVANFTSIGTYTGIGIWNIDVFPINTGHTLTIDAIVDPGTDGSIITNTAKLIGSDVTDPVSLNNGTSVDIFPHDTPSATLTITKQSIGGTGTFEIQNTNSTGTKSHFLTTFGFNGGSNSQNNIDITSGQLQSLTETPQSGWVKTGEFCTINGIDVPGNVTSFIPATGDYVVCQFTNTHESVPAKLIIQKNSGDFPGTFDFTIQNSTKTISAHIATTEINSEHTGSTGPFFFAPDTFSVSEIVPTNWNLDSAECKNNGVSITPPSNLVLTPGADVLCTFTNTRTDAIGEIHGIKLQDGMPLAGVKINATNIDNTVTRETVTDSNGEYWFMDLIPDTYTVNELPPDFSVQVLPVNNQPHTVSVGLGDIITGIDFHNEFVGPSEIHGTIFQDVAPVGTFDASDSGFPNTLVQLSKFNPSSTFPVPTAFTNTDTNGDYEFTNLEPGTYKVQTFPNITPKIQSVPLNNQIPVVTLSGQIVNDVNVGFTPTSGIITGISFIDSNGNGLHDIGELPARSNLICASPGNTCDFSDNSGIYSLNLPPGTYDVSAGTSTTTGTSTFTTINVPSLAIGQTISNIDIPYLDVIPLPGDMDIPNSTGDNADGVPLVISSRSLSIIKDIDVCTPVGSPLATLTVAGGSVLTQSMQNIVGTTLWTVDFGTGFASAGDDAEIRVDIDCPADTVGYPEDITLIGPEDIIQIGDMYFYDPSGQIINQCTNDPIADAFTTLRVASPQGTTNFVIPSTATHLPITNPQITGEDGAYGWVTTPGDYIVTASKVGFVTNTSPVVSIPPPVTGLDIFLTPVNGCDVQLTLEEINQMITDLKAEKQQLKDDAQIQRDSIKSQIQLLKDEKQQINSDTQAQKDIINVQISQLREDRKNVDDPVEKLVISEQIAALHDQKRQLTFDAHNAKFAINQQIMDLQAQKRQLNLDTFLAKKVINDEVAELQKLKRDFNDNISQEKKDISNQISDLQQEKRDINEHLKLDNNALSDETTLLQSERKDIHHQLRVDIKDIADQISTLKSDKRNATTTLEKQMIQDEIDILKDQRTSLRDLAKQEINSIKSQIQLLKDQKQQNKDDANAQKDTINQQIEVLKELRRNL